MTKIFEVKKQSNKLILHRTIFLKNKLLLTAQTLIRKWSLHIAFVLISNKYPTTCAHLGIYAKDNLGIL